MLLHSDVDAAIPLAQELTEKGLRLEAKVGPLAYLVSELFIVGNAANAMSGLKDSLGVPEIGKISEMLIESSGSTHKTEHGSMLDESMHDTKMDEFAELVATGVTTTVMRARGVVFPMVTAAKECIAKAMLDYDNRCILNLGIDEVGINDLLDRDDVLDYFEEYKDIRPNEVLDTKFFPEMTNIDIAKLVESGDIDINDHLTTAMTNTSTSGEMGMFIYNLLYRGESGSNLNSEVYRLRGYLRDYWGDSGVVEGLMLAYHIGKGLLENIPEGVSAAITEIENRVNRLTRVLGHQIYSEIQAYRENCSNRTLFPVGLPYVDRKTGKINNSVNIRVNKDVYMDYLSEGGTPEAIFGTMVSDRCENMGEIIANKEKYERAYDKYVALNRAYTQSSRISLYANAINESIRNSYDTVEELKSQGSSSGCFVRLDQGLKRMGYSDIEDEESLQRYLIGLCSQVAYPDDPNVERVIVDIESFNSDEEMEVSDIAALVLVDVVVDWLSEQIVVRG